MRNEMEMGAPKKPEVNSKETNRLLVVKLLDEKGYGEKSGEVLKFKNVTVWCPNDVEISGKIVKNGEILGGELDVSEILEIAEEIHNQGGSIQAFLPDGKYLSSYNGVYEQDGETPANKTGVEWAIK